MKKVLVLCLATIVALCSFAQKGQEEFEKGMKAYENHLYVEAVSWFKKSAEQGNAFAQYRLGSCYVTGFGLEKTDIFKAASWYKQAVPGLEKAAGEGNAEAQHLLGTCYRYGYGIHRNYTEAKYWYEKAAAQGNESAIKDLKELK